ncbi:RING zinc finger protein, putative [Plasmodium ovale curtisi]|uniref:RING zinc finger protein, putative n=1 Tax=Plasmodium ovale curtisi TaxID=864141 RepID=A0A1A8VTL2_PLAOA|nr:RING zinc finger protein, putative [Plasmodium ovale curtisi]
MVIAKYERLPGIHMLNVMEHAKTEQDRSVVFCSVYKRILQQMWKDAKHAHRILRVSKAAKLHGKKRNEKRSKKRSYNKSDLRSTTEYLHILLLLHQFSSGENSIGSSRGWRIRSNHVSAYTSPCVGRIVYGKAWRHRTLQQRMHFLTYELLVPAVQSVSGKSDTNTLHQVKTMQRRSGESKHMHFINSANSRKKLNIVEKINVLEKVHILPIEKSISNFDQLYGKLNVLRNDKCVLHEGFIINLNGSEGEKEAVIGNIKDFHRKNQQICANKEENSSSDRNEKLKENEMNFEIGKNTMEEGNTEAGNPDEGNLSTVGENASIHNKDQISMPKEENTEEGKDVHFNNQVKYVVINCIPSRGVLSKDTLIYTDGKYVNTLNKIHIIIIRDRNYNIYHRKVKRKLFSLKKYFLKKGSEFFSEVISFFPFYVDSFSKKSEEKRKNNMNVLMFSNSKKGSISSTPLLQKKKKKNFILQKILLSYLHPYFKNNRSRLFYAGKLILTNNFTFLVSKVDADVDVGVGFVDDATEIVLSADSYEQYDRVHIVPMHDTLPTTYNYNLFRDYIRPYLERHYLDVFSIYDTFFYKGIQFKIMGVNPENVMYGKGRISCNTFIYMNGAIKPTFFDVISKESMNYIKCLPFEYKPYAVLNILQHLDTDSLLRLFPSSNGSMHGDRTREEGVFRLLTKHRYVFGKAESLTGGGERDCVDIYEGRRDNTNSDEGRSGDNDEVGDGEDDGCRNRVGQERDEVVSRKSLINDHLERGERKLGGRGGKEQTVRRMGQESVPPSTLQPIVEISNVVDSH